MYSSLSATGEIVLLLKSRSTLFMNAVGYSAFRNFSLIILVSFPKFDEILFDLLKSQLMAFRLYLLGTHNDQWGVSLVSFLNTADFNLLLAIIFVSKNFSGLISQVSFMFWWKLFRNWKSLSGMFFFRLVKISSINCL